MAADVVTPALVAVPAFFIGAVNPASLIARARGSDLQLGSGNPGATNAGRVMGPRWGVVVFLLDVAKAFLPSLAALLWLGLASGLVAGLAVVLGHNFSPFLRGRGGKGVSCTFGALLAVVPWVALIAFAVFALTFAVARYVGSASVVTALALVLIGVGVGAGLVPSLQQVVGWWLVALGLVVLLRHRRNVLAWWGRLRA